MIFRNPNRYNMTEREYKVKRIISAAIFIAIIFFSLFSYIKDKFFMGEAPTHDPQTFVSDSSGASVELPQSESGYIEEDAEKKEFVFPTAGGGWLSNDKLFSESTSATEADTEVKNVLAVASSAMNDYTYFESENNIEMTKSSNSVTSKLTSYLLKKKDEVTDDAYYKTIDRVFLRDEVYDEQQIICYEKHDSDGEFYCYYMNTDIGIWQRAKMGEITTIDVTCKLNFSNEDLKLLRLSEEIEEVDGKSCIVLETKELNQLAKEIEEYDGGVIKEFRYKIYIDEVSKLPHLEEIYIDYYTQSSIEGDNRINYIYNDKTYYRYQKEGEVEVPENVMETYIDVDVENIE